MPPRDASHSDSKCEFLKSGRLEVKVDCNYTFLIDLTPNGIPLGVKSIGRVKLQSAFGEKKKSFIAKNLGNIYIFSSGFFFVVEGFEAYVELISFKKCPSYYFF